MVAALLNDCKQLLSHQTLLHLLLCLVSTLVLLVLASALLLQRNSVLFFRHRFLILCPVAMHIKIPLAASDELIRVHYLIPASSLIHCLVFPVLSSFQILVPRKFGLLLIAPVADHGLVSRQHSWFVLQTPCLALAVLLLVLTPGYF